VEEIVMNVELDFMEIQVTVDLVIKAAVEGGYLKDNKVTLDYHLTSVLLSYQEENYNSYTAGILHLFSWNIACGL
jgi:hypothetical protein